ncbi:MAG: hypothetical protein FJY85_17540, partial [Deltaproteobacteria bacterium]|nr:hypothetical protein [Deltaproteobacteria bacterium]
AHLDAVGDDTTLADYPMPNDVGKLRLFLLILADHLASSVSRATAERGRGEGRWEVNVLWRGRGPHPTGTVMTIDGLRDMLKFIVADPSAEEFLQKYGPSLRDTPEEKQTPRDATSLHTHVRLVGQFYRVLEANLESATGTLPPMYAETKVESLADAEGKGSEAGKWPYRLLWYRIRFPQALVRARDLNVFILREYCLKSILQQWPDNVLLHTSDGLTLFLPRNLSSSEVLRPLLVEGFFVDGVELVGDLGSLSAERLEEQWLRKRKQALELEAQREQIGKERKLRYAEAAKKGELQDKEQKEAFEKDVIRPLLEKENEYAEQIKRLRGELGQPYERVIEIGPCSVYYRDVAEAETFAPPICELCQLRPGTCGWVPTQRLPVSSYQETDQLVEHLCERCFTIRQMGYPTEEGRPQGKMFHHLEGWSEDDLPVAWVRV